MQKQYTYSAFILGFVALLSLAWVAQSQAETNGRRYINTVFEGYTRTADIVYGQNFNDLTKANEQLKFRLFEPKGDTAKKRPLIIITPGGGFVQHEDHWMDDFGVELARSGYVVAINRYRLSASSSLTSGEYYDALFKSFSDQKSLIRHFVKDAAGANRYKIDVDNIFISGHSAGAITSMHVAYLDTKDKLTQQMKAAMEKHGGIEGNSGNAGFDFTIRGVINLSGFVTELDMLSAEGPALLSIHGDKDAAVWIGTKNGVQHGSKIIHEHAEKIGMNHELKVIVGAEHNDPASSSICPECLPLIKRFVFNNLYQNTPSVALKPSED